jgi:peptide/nickel transport system substrate-binding protein
MRTKLTLLMSILVIATMLLTACGTAATTVAPAAPTEPAAKATEAPVVAAKATEAPAAPAATEAPAVPAAPARYPKLTIAISMDPGDLKPFGVNMGSKPVIYHEIYEYLFDLVDNNYAPVLAKDFTKVDDLHYEVHLNQNIVDSAGNPIKASDVVFSTQKLVEAGQNFKWYMVGDIKAKDDYTVEYTWTKPITDVGELEFPWCRTVIFSQKSYEASADQFATKPVGTGPYRVKEFTSGSKVILEANDSYWAKDKPAANHTANVQTIEYDIIGEAAQNVIALQTGAVDYSENVPTENFADFQSGGKYADKFVTNVMSGSFVYAMNANTSEGHPGADLNFRMAVWYAIDNEAIATALQGTLVPAKAFGTPHFAAEYQSAWDTTPNYVNTFDPAKAQELLKKTTYTGQKLILTYNQDPTSETIATVVQSFLLNVGINVELKSLDQASGGAIDTTSDGYDIKVFGMGGGSLIGEWNRVMNNHELGKDYSVGFVKDSQLQKLFETANAIDTHTAENLTALENYVLANGYFYAVGSPRINQVYNKNVTKIVMRESEFIWPGACTYAQP